MQSSRASWGACNCRNRVLLVLLCTRTYSTLNPGFAVVRTLPRWYHHHMHPRHTSRSPSDTFILLQINRRCRKEHVIQIVARSQPPTLWTRLNNTLLMLIGGGCSYPSIPGPLPRLNFLEHYHSSHYTAWLVHQLGLCMKPSSLVKRVLYLGMQCTPFPGPLDQRLWL